MRPVVVTLMQWGDHWVRDDEPPTTIVDTVTGAVIDPVLVDRGTGTPLDDMRLHARGRVTAGIERPTDAAL